MQSLAGKIHEPTYGNFEWLNVKYNTTILLYKIKKK